MNTSRALVLAFLSVGFSTEIWAHDGEMVTGISDVAVTVPHQFKSDVTGQGSEDHVLGVRDHETSLVDTCPQLAYEAETDGLRNCVTVLTSQISDLLKLIMNLSDALAESQNQLMRGSLEPQGRPIIHGPVPQS